MNAYAWKCLTVIVIGFALLLVVLYFEVTG